MLLTAAKRGVFYNCPGSGKHPVLPFIHLTDITEPAGHRGYIQNKTDMAPAHQP